MCLAQAGHNAMAPVRLEGLLVRISLLAESLCCFLEHDTLSMTLKPGDRFQRCIIIGLY